MDTIEKIPAHSQYLSKGLCIALRSDSDEFRSKQFIQFATEPEDNVNIKATTVFQQSLIEALRTAPGLLRIGFSSGVITVSFSGTKDETVFRRSQIEGRLKKIFDLE